MATNYPNALDTFVNPSGGSSTTAVDHAAQHANANDAIKALQAKVGVNNSAVSSSHDYKITQLATTAHTHANKTTLDATTASYTTAEASKLAGIEANADVTDAANVEAAGAVMESDTSTSAMSFVVDEDDMASDSATKVPTQQSVKAYVDNEIANVGGGGGSMDDFTLAGDSGTSQTISDGDTLTIAGGTGIDTVAQNTDTVTVALDSATQASLAKAETALQGVDWGDIGGTLSAQTDLSNALSGKQDADALLEDIAALSDPNADRLLFWDDSAGDITWLTPSTGLSISNTDMTVRSANTTQTGIVELATTAETEVGTDTTRAVTPDALHDMTTLSGAAWFLDEDNMASDSAVKVPSQQSVKAYVDNGLAGKLTLQGANVINESGADVDQRIEGDNDQNLVFVDASTDRVGIGTASPSAKFDVNGSASYVFTAEPPSDHTALGPKMSMIAAGESITQMNLVYFSTTDGEWMNADADAVATCSSMMAIALAAGTNGNSLLVAVKGSIVRDDSWSWTPGQILYASTTAGGITATAPSGTDDVVRVVGYALTDDCIYFSPEETFVVHA